MLRSCVTAHRIQNTASWRSYRLYSAAGRLRADDARRKRGRPRKDDGLLEANKTATGLNDAPSELESVLVEESDHDGPRANKFSTLLPEPSPEDKPTRTKRPKFTKHDPIKFPPRIIADTKHHDLSSFLHHAALTSLDPTSNVFKGTLYEYRVAETLQAYNFTLARIGRPDDLGIDLIGHWRLPGHKRSRPHELRIILQCKALKPRPSMIRELEGAYAGAPAGWRDEGVMGILVADGEVTKGVGEALQRSRYPMGVMNVTQEGVMVQFLWNEVAARVGLEGLGVAVRYSVINGASGGEADVGQSIALTWLGQVWRKKGGS